MNKFGNFLWGLVFIILGIILGCNAIGITNIDIFFEGWWTLFIIIPCFIGIFNEKDKTGSIIGLVIGISLLLTSQNVISFDIVWKLIVPVVLVALGISLIFKDVLNKKVKSEIKKVSDKNGKKSDAEYSAIFAGQDINFANEEFKGAELTAIFGGINCDLRNTIINDDQIINCTSIFGGIEILAPANVKIKINSTPVFGGVSDETTHEYPEDCKIIYINATSIFGGVEIK